VTAYLYVDIEIMDPAKFEEYRNLVPAVIAAHHGRYLVRGGAVEVLEGDRQPKRQVILEFPDMAHLKAFYDSAAYQPLKLMRQRSSKATVIAVEGYA
jgi:uncharacterized protein (DUF1330 family)